MPEAGEKFAATVSWQAIRDNVFAFHNHFLELQSNNASTSFHIGMTVWLAAAQFIVHRRYL